MICLTGLLVLFAGCATTLKPPGGAEAALYDKECRDPRSIERAWGDFLRKFVDPNGRIDYARAKAEPEAINRAYELVASCSPDSHPEAFPTEAARFAYWLNAYNIAVVYAVTQAYPIESVQDVSTASPLSLIEGGGFFAAQRLYFGGRAMTLYALENSLIRKRFADPRLHFALNCASGSCPELPGQPFVPERLDGQLDNETRKFLADSKNFRINHEQRRILVSSIFQWFEEDFLRYLRSRGIKDPTLIDYPAPYLGERMRDELALARERGYAVEFIPYDWSLNDRRSD